MDGPRASHTKRSQVDKLSYESVMPSNHLIFCHPLLLPPSILPSIRVFSNELPLCIRWPKYWSFSFTNSLSNEYSGLIFFRIDWFDLLAVQGTLESSPTPQFKSINSLALSLPHSPTLTSIHDHWKNHSLDWTNLCWQSNVFAFEYAIYVGHNFPSKECLLISWLQSPSAVILEPPKINSDIFPLFPHLFPMK